MNSEIDLVQLSLIKKSKKYLTDCEKKGINISLSPFCDLTTWINSLGYQKLHLINKNKFFSKSYLRYFLSKAKLQIIIVTIKIYSSHICFIINSNAMACAMMFIYCYAIVTYELVITKY